MRDPAQACFVLGALLPYICNSGVTVGPPGSGSVDGGSHRVLMEIGWLKWPHHRPSVVHVDRGAALHVGTLLGRLAQLRVRWLLDHPGETNAVDWGHCEYRGVAMCSNNGAMGFTSTVGDIAVGYFKTALEAALVRDDLLRSSQNESLYDPLFYRGNPHGRFEFLATACRMVEVFLAALDDRPAAAPAAAPAAEVEP